MLHKIVTAHINQLKPTGHVMHHQFNIQQLYALSTLYLCVLYLSENKQRPDSHLHRVKNTKCRIDGVISPDDGHILTRNMYRKQIKHTKKNCVPS
jgi:hypothetical protein